MEGPKRPSKASSSGRLPRRGGPAPARPVEADEEAGVDVASPTSSSGRTDPAGSAPEGSPAPDSPGGSEESGGTASAPGVSRTRRLPAVKAKAGTTGAHKAVSGAKPPARRARGEDPAAGEDAPTDFKGGLPLAAKIAIFTALLVAVSMSVLGWQLFGLASAKIDEQINEKGIAATNAFASQLDRICFVKTTNPAVAEVVDPLRDEAIARWKQKLERYVSTPGQEIFLNMLVTWEAGGEKLTLVSTNERRPPVALAAVEAQQDRYTVAPKREMNGVQIFEGRYESPRFTGRVRKYVQKIPAGTVDLPVEEGQGGARGGAFGAAVAAPPSKTTSEDGFLHVFIKADEIDRVREEMYHKLMVATGTGIGVAVLLSIAVAAFLAAPLRALVEDMRVVANGKLDHRTVPRSADEIGLVAAQFNDMTASLRQAQRLEQERQAIEHELTIATEIQTKLLPERIPQIAGFDLFSFYLSAKEVGGDYYDFLVIDPTHLGIVVADVSGKGVPGAMVMTMVRSLLRLASHRETSPGETLKKVNRILAKDMRRGMFVTAVYAVLDVSRKTLTVASAGHNPMLYYSAKTGTCRPVSPSGIALGFDKGRTFDENLKEETIELAPGDRCVFYTDGVVEAMSEREEEFGQERFQGLLGEHAAKSSKDFTNALVEALEDHRGGGRQSDDITITTLRVE